MSGEECIELSVDVGDDGLELLTMCGRCVEAATRLGWEWVAERNSLEGRGARTEWECRTTDWTNWGARNTKHASGVGYSR